MTDSHTFEYDGYQVAYSAAVVRTSLEKRRLQGKLLDAYGYLDDPDGVIPRDEWDNIDEYTTAMSQCKTTAAWWVSSNATPQEVRAAYEIFLEQDPILYRLFQNASSAVTAPKKSQVSILPTSSP